MAIEIIEKTVTFKAAVGDSASGGRRTVRQQTVDIQFSMPVVSVQAAAVKGFDIEFANNEHPLLRQCVRIANVTKVAANPQDPYWDRKVWVTVMFGLRDNSGDWDDPFSGYVDVVIIAEVDDLRDPQVVHGGVAVALKASNGKYLTAEATGGQKLMATKSLIGDDERFWIEIVDNLASGYLANLTQLALRTSGGKFICAENGGGREVIANRGQIGAWETFSVRKVTAGTTIATRGLDHILNGNSIALQASNGQFVCAEGGGGREIVANRHRVGPWESFVVELAP